MKLTASNVTLPEQELKNLSIEDIRRRKARAEGLPEPALTVAEVAQTAGALKLAELRARRTSLIEPFEHDGETWHLLKMNGAKQREVGIRMARYGDGSLMLIGDDQMTALIKATLQVGVVKGERDPSPYFNPTPYMMEDAYGNLLETTECEQFVDEPETDELCAVLFDRLTDMNEKIWPMKKKALELGRRLTNSMSTNSQAGLSNAEAAPSLLPTDLEDLPNTDD